MRTFNGLDVLLFILIIHGRTAKRMQLRSSPATAIPFNVEIPVAFETPQPSSSTFWGFTLIGLYVGVIPVFLGIFWFPALRQLGRRTMTFLMAATAGLLVFLGLDTIAEAFEIAAKVPSAFQGIGLIGIGAVATFLLLDAISKRQTEITGSEMQTADLPSPS